MKNNIINFKGIKFYNCSFDFIFKKINKGGYLVAPAASALASINSNKKYHQSLIKSDIAILDSGFFCILLRIFKGESVSKLSGYFFLKNFLNMKIKKYKILTIDPSHEDSKANLKYLKFKKFKKIINYIAPIYNKKKIIDKKLIKIIKKNKPKYIIINLGGGIQESLALFIKKKIKFKTSVFCTGAAIAFLTRRQAPINDVVDKLYLGWLARTLHDPKKFFFRTIKSLSLIKLFIFD